MKINNTLIVSLVVGVFLTVVHPMPTQAGESAQKALQEIEAMFGSVPSYFQVYPHSAIAGALEWMKATDMSEEAELTAKTRELIALGVAAQIPCKYCIYYHTKAAAAAGATQQEIREAVLAASVVRHWSTILHGNEYDFEAFKAETDGFFPDQQGSAASGSGGAEELHALNEKWVNAFKNGDFGYIEELMAADSLLLSPNEPAVQGPPAIVDVWRSWHKLPNPRVGWGPNRVEIASAGDMAYEYGWYVFEFDTQDGRTKDKGKYVTVWRKNSGDWKVVADIFNSDLPAQ